MTTLYDLFGLPDPDVKAKPEGTAVGRGWTQAWEQLPQLGYGLAAGAGAAVESATGEGGIGTGVKKWALKGYQDWGDRIATTSADTDSISKAWDMAKEGDIGALGSWLGWALGYSVAQGTQMIATGGLGYAVGKWGLKNTAEAIASGMVRKEAERLTAESAGKIAADQISRQAVSNVAGRLGQLGAVGATAFGMEGGEIFGDLVQQADKEGRTLTGAELARALGATAAAGSLEFVGDKFALDAVLGKSALVKKAMSAAEEAKGVGGRIARGAIAGVAVAPAEAATEFFQTGLEEWGKGQEPSALPWEQSAENLRQAIDAAALGAAGGAIMGGAGGLFTRAKDRAAPPPAADASGLVTVPPPVGPSAATPPAPSLPPQIPPGTAPQPAGAPESAPTAASAIEPAAASEQPNAPLRASQRPESGDSADDALNNILSATTMDEMLSAALRASGSPSLIHPWRTQENQRLLDARRAAESAQKDGELDLIAQAVGEHVAKLPVEPALVGPVQSPERLATERAASLEGPSLMQLALGRAMAPPAPAPVVEPPQPRIVARTPDMRVTSLAKATAEAQAKGGEVVRVQNLSGKFGYVALLPAKTVDEGAHQAATSPTNDLKEPTWPQKEAGNGTLGHTKVGGLDISIENPQGSTRSSKPSAAKQWEQQMRDHYGYIRGTIGKDKDHLDVFVKPGTPETWNGDVYVVDQVNPDNAKFDEHKPMVGYDSEAEARAAYLSNYEAGWQGIKSITTMPFDEFKDWAFDRKKTQREAAPQVTADLRRRLSVLQSLRLCLMG